jgi:hypothetical protein
VINNGKSKIFCLIGLKLKLGVNPQLFEKYNVSQWQLIGLKGIRNCADVRNKRLACNVAKARIGDWALKNVE